MIQKWVTYGGEITFDDSGNEVFEHIPHDSLIVADRKAQKIIPKVRCMIKFSEPELNSEP